MEPLIDPRSVVQSGLGRIVEQLDPRSQTLVSTRAVVLRVYPPGHPENRIGQTQVDVRPLDGLPILRRVPVALAYAHQETDIEEARTARRQPYAPKARNRVEGSVRDLRPGTHVLVQFLGGAMYEPIVTATLKPNDQGAQAFPVERQHVDRIGADGALETDETHPLDSAVDRSDPDHPRSSYPRSADVCNGVRREVDNTGSYYIQTSTDREPVFPGHNGVPASPPPRGNYGVSTRGAAQGHIQFTTGRDPELDEPSAGRQGRQTLNADDGTIRDDTRSAIGNLIQRLRSEVGRYYLSTRGSGNGGVYLEDKDRNYLALVEGAELHGEDQVVLDAPAVKLGSGEATFHAVLWEQLVECLTALVEVFDNHVHGGVESGSDSTDKPAAFQAPVLAQHVDNFRSDVVTLDKDAASTASFQDDPDQ